MKGFISGYARGRLIKELHGINESLSKIESKLNLTGTERKCAGDCGRPARHSSNFCEYYFAGKGWGCRPVGTAGEKKEKMRAYLELERELFPSHGLTKEKVEEICIPDLPLHARVAKALGKHIMNGDIGWVYFEDNMPYPIPDYPNDLVAAIEAFDLYFELQCRKIDDHFDYWIERFYKDGWKWRVRFGFADKSVIADSQAEGLCEAIVAHREGK